MPPPLGTCFSRCALPCSGQHHCHCHFKLRMGARLSPTGHSPPPRQTLGSERGSGGRGRELKHASPAAGRPRFLRFHLLQLAHVVFFLQTRQGPAPAKRLGPAEGSDGSIFSNRVLLIKVCTFLDTILLHTYKRLQCSVNITFISTGELFKICDSLYCDLCSIAVFALPRWSGSDPAVSPT